MANYPSDLEIANAANKKPIIEIAKYIIDDLRNILTIDAIIIPINPIIRKDPILVKSLLVV